MQHLCGWVPNPEEVDKVVSNLKYKSVDELDKVHNLYKRTAGNDPVLLYKYFKDVVGSFATCGPQKIGDCVSWGWSNVVNHVAALQIWAKLNKLNFTKFLDGAGGFIREAQDHPDYLAAVSILEEYEENCTEIVYGGSRVQVGGQKGSQEDGSVGAWAAKFVAEFGTLSRLKVKAAGMAPDYDPNRAKQWGAQGVPDSLLPLCKNHLIKDVVPVTSYQDAVTMIRAYKPVAVCSNQGFEEQRDSSGACRPSGTWNHCMSFVAVDDKGRLLCWQNWGPTDHPNGPVYLDQPPNTWWTDPNTADRMLKQNDSFAGADFMGYQIEDFLTWQH